MPGTPQQHGSLSKWEARLSNMYAVVAYLEGDDRWRATLEPPVEEEVEEKAGAAGATGGEKKEEGGEDGDAAACPFTGQTAAGGQCPFGFGGGGSGTTEEGGGMKGATDGAEGAGIEEKLLFGEGEGVSGLQGECPWPFIMMHDPVGGAVRHAGKNMAAAVVLIAVLLAVLGAHHVFGYEYGALLDF